MRFLRRLWGRYSKLGKRRKKKQKWRRPTGRDNKMRERRRGYPSRVSIGYKQKETGKKDFIIMNKNDLNKVKGKPSLNILVGSVGKKKKMEIAREANKKGIEIQNLNVKKLLKNELKK